MKRLVFYGFGFLTLIAFLVLIIWPLGNVLALPEYSAQTGEPCATCHVSPSGGGPRAPRGQAWIADGKPSTVPDLLLALELLGVDLDVDMSDFTKVPGDIPPVQPLPLQPKQIEKLHQHLFTYPGN